MAGPRVVAVEGVALRGLSLLYKCRHWRLMLGCVSHRAVLLSFSAGAGAAEGRGAVPHRLPDGGAVPGGGEHL